MDFHEMISQARTEYATLAKELKDLIETRSSFGTQAEFDARLDPIQVRLDEKAAEVDRLQSRQKNLEEMERRSNEYAQSMDLNSRSASGRGNSGSAPAWIDRGALAFGPEDLEMLEARAIQRLFRGVMDARDTSQMIGYEARSYMQVFGETESRNMGITTANASTVALGPQAVGTTFIGQVIEQIRDKSMFRQYCRVMRTPRGETITIPRHTGNTTAVWVGEREAFTASNIGLDTITLGAYKYGLLTILSNELVQDEALAPELLAIVRQDTVDGMGVLANAAFIAGDGSNKPTGLVPNISTGVTAAGTADVTPEELLDLQFSVPETVRKRGRYYMSSSGLHVVRSRTDSAGRPIWHAGVPGTEGGTPGTLWGQPYTVDEGLDTVATGNAPFLYGDLNAAYVVRDVLGLEIRRSDEYRFDTDGVAFRIRARVDGKPRQPAAMRKLVMS